MDCPGMKEEGPHIYPVFVLSCAIGIMPHAETDLAIPWAIVCLLLMITGAYGLWASTKVSEALDTFYYHSVKLSVQKAERLND